MDYRHTVAKLLGLKIFHMAAQSYCMLFKITPLLNPALYTQETEYNLKYLMVYEIYLDTHFGKIYVNLFLRKNKTIL